MTTIKNDYNNSYSQPVNNALTQLEGANQVVKLLAAEAILENVIRDIDEDDLTAAMLEQVLEIMAVLIERN
jgi:hypothetical protein